jgi:predicted ATPase/DNA-binding CsgD family transcriptional regulator/Tfp pilus assembly protein PilF
MAEPVQSAPYGQMQLDTARSACEPCLPEQDQLLPWAPLSAAGNLPAAVSGFVGRAQELAALTELAGAARLVTLVGPAGVGKTRLALEVATSVTGEYANGVWLVSLDPVADPRLVASAVAAALGVREQPGQPLLETLINQLRHRCLRDRCVLVVLDNCEHLIEPAARLVDALLGACPGLVVLATSRQPLRIGGERVWPVPPLSTPGAAAMSVEQLDGYEAVRLFVERAQAVRPGFALTAGVAPAVGEICQRLDGLSLAIELAAARVGVLSPAQIASRLDDRFGLLTEGSRTAPHRHESLQAALDWSYALLSEPEQMLLRRLSVFTGGFVLKASEQICAGAGLQPDQVFAQLAGLVAKSLVIADTSGAQAHYKLLETIRAYGADKLSQAGETKAVRAHHAACYTELAEQAEPELGGVDQKVWLERLEVEHNNLRAALEYSLACGQPKQGLRLASALAQFWMLRGYLSESRAWLDQALAAAPNAPVLLRAKAFVGASLLAGTAGDFPTAVAAGQQSLALARQAGDAQTSALALSMLGRFVMFADLPKAGRLVEDAITLARQTNDRRCLICSLIMLGWARLFQNNLAATHALLEEGLDLALRQHNQTAASEALIGLGNAALQQGNYQTAQTSLNNGLKLTRELDLPFWTAMALVYLGGLAKAQGHYARARMLFDDAVAAARTSGFDFVVALALEGLGKLAQAKADPAAAYQLFEQALTLVQDADNKIQTTTLRISLGEVCYTLGRSEAARAFFEQALPDARNNEANTATAQALTGLGRLARSEGDHHAAAALHQQALHCYQQTGCLPSMIESLEALAGLAADFGRCNHAARLLGAAHTLRQTLGHVRPPAEQPGYEADLTTTKKGLSAEEFTKAWEQGQHLSAAEVVAYAAKARGPRQRPTTGWASLTRAERDVTRLAAEGLTNSQIGQRLFISPRTVQAHLSRVYAKLGITSRTQLAQHSTPSTLGFS